MPDQCPSFGDYHNRYLFTMSLAIVQNSAEYLSLTKVAFRISPILVETAMTNGLDEIIMVNELKMRDTELGCPWSDTQPWKIKSSSYSLNCFPEMWNWMNGKQIQATKARMTLLVRQHMTWSRHYTFTRIRDSFVREHAITGPLGLSISMGFSGSSRSLMCLICSCTWPHRQSTHTALNVIRLHYQKRVPKALLKVRQKL